MSRFHSSCICGCKNCKRSDNHIQILSTLTLSVLMMRPEKLYSRHCRQYEFGIRFHSCSYYKYFRVLTPLLYPQQCHAGLQVAHSLNYKAGNMTRTWNTRCGQTWAAAASSFLVHMQRVHGQDSLKLDRNKQLILISFMSYLK